MEINLYSIRIFSDCGWSKRNSNFENLKQPLLAFMLKYEHCCESDFKVTVQVHTRIELLVWLKYMTYFAVETDIFGEEGNTASIRTSNTLINIE
jgi:hypothetical protein